MSYWAAELPSKPHPGRRRSEFRSSQDLIDYEDRYLDCSNNSSSRDSDDSPILSYRYDKCRGRHYTSSNHTRRSVGSVLAKVFLFCTAMILFCVFMYIPVYNKVNRQLPKGIVAGWSVHTSRDTKIYIQPENVTIIHEPRNVCNKENKNKLFLLTVVYSSTDNFKARSVIRDTWGKYENYMKMSKIFNIVKKKYQNYNYTYNLYPNQDDLDPNKTSDISLNKFSDKDVSGTSDIIRHKRGISGLSQLLPHLAASLQENFKNAKTEEETRFDEITDKMLSSFDMNKVIGDQITDDFDYDDTNVMKIPPRGYEDPTDLDEILSRLKKTQISIISKDSLSDDNKLVSNELNSDENVFKLVFLLGMPTQDNDSSVQGKIDEEVENYGDIIQEGFMDSYNNLTLKSVMMLKWIVNHCNNSVRYILKTDDDMFINMPNLISSLLNKSKEFDIQNKNGVSKSKEEYLLIGDLISNARPISDSNDKWYSPGYMFGGRVYPRYLSGTGYAFSVPTARALFGAALRTPLFHLEDIYITGMCAARASPRIRPKDDPGFSYLTVNNVELCSVYSHISSHRVPYYAMPALINRLSNELLVDTCERIRLTQMRKHTSMYNKIMNILQQG